MVNDYFFIVGAQRSGTTYLYHLLAEHPEIEMAQPLKPEPKFFITDALFCNGLDYYKNSYFEGKVGAWLRGEKSTSYIELETAAIRLAASFPKAKIVFLLRNPIERAISNYWFSVNNGLETKSIEEAFLQEEERVVDYDPDQVSVSPYAYLRRGRYIDYILMYERYFPSKSIRVMLYEQLISSVRFVHDLYTFLGVTNNFVPAVIYQTKNRGSKPDDFSLPSELRPYLLDYFAKSNDQLADRFGFDLEEWGWI